MERKRMSGKLKEFPKTQTKDQLLKDWEDIERQLNSSLKYEYGGDWEYNEIIGYLEFYKIGNNIRCAYYKVIAKKIFKGNVEDIIDLPEKKYSINKEALSNIQSYIEIL